MPAVFTAADARHWALLTRAALAARRTEIDALNVFPVPDGDTGTNLYLTFDAAIDEVVAPTRPPASSARPPSCRSAAPSSGPSCSRPAATPASSSASSSAACATPSSSATPRSSTRLLLADAFARGAAAARACVAHPQEGTILTVADAGAAAAVEAAEAGGSLADVCEAAVDAAQEALARTPDQLEALARAGVVDAGGAGCVLMLESFHRVVTGRWSATDEGLLSAGPPLHRRDEWRHRPRMPCTTPGDRRQRLTGRCPGTTRSTAPTAAHGDGPGLRGDVPAHRHHPRGGRDAHGTLDGLGDSLLVVGGPDLWNVHVHVDDPGAAVEAGVAAGRPERIRITHFASQVAAREQPVPLAVVACAAGPGIGALLEEAGAVVVASGPGPAGLGRPAARGGPRRPGRRRRCCCPATATPSWPPRSPPRRPPARASTRTSCRPARPCRPSPRSPCSTPPARCTPTSSR